MMGAEFIESVDGLPLFHVSKRVIHTLPGSFVKATPHDGDDWEHPDRLWLEWTPEGDLCEGQYISVSKLVEDGSLWNIETCSADRFGGHPTLWDASGSEAEVELAVIDHLTKLGE